MKLDTFIIRQKEGVIVGGLVGLLIYLEANYNLSSRFIEYFKIPLQPSWYSLVVFILIGILCGGVVDIIYRKDL